MIVKPDVVDQSFKGPVERPDGVPRVVADRVAGLIGRIERLKRVEGDPLLRGEFAVEVELQEHAARIEDPGHVRPSTDRQRRADPLAIRQTFRAQPHPLVRFQAYR